MSPKHWRDRVSHILDAIREIREFTNGMDRTAFKRDARTVKAVCTDFTIIGEAVGHIPDEIRALAPGIEWSKIRGMRNFVVHVYHAIDEDVLWDTIQNDLTPLESSLRTLLDRPDTDLAGR